MKEKEMKELSPKVEEIGMIRQMYRCSLPEQVRIEIRRKIRKFKKVLGQPTPKKVDPIPGMLAEAKRLLSAWQLEASLSLVEGILELDSENRRALQLKGVLLGNLGKLKESLSVTLSTLEKYPLDVPSLKQLRALGYKPKEASRITAIAYARNYNYDPVICLECAEYLYDAELFAESVELCEVGLAAISALKYTAKLALVAGQLKIEKAKALEADGKLKDAEDLYCSLLVEPAVGRSAVVGLARCLLEYGKSDRAESLLEAIGKKATVFSSLMLDVLQAQGRLRDSYLLYRKRPVSRAMAKAFSMPHPPEELNICDSANKFKKALILLEGGPGDEIRFSTLYNDIADKFLKVTMTCDPRLESVMSRSFPHISFIPVPRRRREFVENMLDRTKIPDAVLFQCVTDNVLEESSKYEVVCSILDTLADVRPNFDSFPTSKNSLQPCEALVSYWSEQLEPTKKVRIGLAWRSMLQTVARNKHYFTVNQLVSLKDIPNCEFWLLQPGVTEGEIAFLRQHIDIHVPKDLDLVDDFENQLALISCLDYVISPFTTTGELAAACGVPVLLTSTSRNTTWRRQKSGYDIWHSNATIISIPEESSKQKVVEETVHYLNEQIAGLDCRKRKPIEVVSVAERESDM
ncbi:tetratricopeptide repeat protein [Billgrantia bachuensis]|uniref:Uncharacterized protein n=1 Tax=Billgrantia bachuensis TaxID=2717286 RepID=A0ABX0PLK7_9GAMM|nr:hypothetical protein [Halomonas bachuensis]NIC04159.1 hypothetical protein [Halomonas bachuensis]